MIILLESQNEMPLFRTIALHHDDSSWSFICKEVDLKFLLFTPVLPQEIKHSKISLLELLK